MNIASIICEYNPFHSGHKYQIDTIKKQIKDVKIIALMSGNFVQRGGVAILDKHTRAKIALKNGADLVIELLPFFSTQVAPVFALGAVSTLNSLNIIDYLCFGSETEDIEKLYEFSKKDIQDKNKKDCELRQNLKSGMSFIKAYSLSNENTANTSNDILSNEYLKAISITNSKIKPFNIKRKGSSYNDNELKEEFSSATSIRKALKAGDENAFGFLMQNSKDYFQYKYLKYDSDFYKYIKYAIIKENTKLNEVFEVNEGLENLLIKNIEISSNLEDLIEKTKSKRYTYAKIRRMLFNILLDIKKSQINLIQEKNYIVPYIRILGFNDNARDILKTLKKSSDIKIINKQANFKPETDYENMFLQKDILCTKIYNMEKNSYYYNDYLTSPVYLKNKK